jgi:hypothetical protein
MKYDSCSRCISDTIDEISHDTATRSSRQSEYWKWSVSCISKEIESLRRELQTSAISQFSLILTCEEKIDEVPSLSLIHGRYADLERLFYADDAYLIGIARMLGCTEEIRHCSLDQILRSTRTLAM